MKRNKILISILLIVCFLINMFFFKVFASNNSNNPFEVIISYEYDNQKNIVLVHAKSNREMKQKTLPGWVLGSDKMAYTAEYETNQTFSTYFTDLNGNKILKEIKIDQVDQSGRPNINVSYQYNSNNNTVMVTAKSDRKLIQKTLAGWKLSEDKKTYTAEYKTNQMFTTNFTDIYGNKTPVQIKVTQVDDKGPVVNANYTYNSSSNTVKVIVTANEEMKQKTLAGWTLSEDKKIYTAEYETNQTFTTNFTDKWGNKTPTQIKINQINQSGKPNINVSYQYNSDNNTVIITAKSDRKLIQKTLAGWTLSADKKTYTAEYETNQTFTTNFTDIYGNKAPTQIKINQINQNGRPNINVSYEYNSSNNTVIVTAKSDRKLIQKTLAGWKLSEDKKTYIAEYKTNQTFTTNFTDIYGNKTPVQIKITQVDDKGPVLNTNYTYNSSNNTVKVIVTANEEMKQKTLAGWTLSEDKKTYTAEYKTNQTFITNFTDIYGNKTPMQIKIDQIDDQAPKINIEYVYNDNNTVTINLKSNEKMGNTKSSSWTLSQDQLTYSRIVNENQDYVTYVEDIWGNTVAVPIRLKFKKSDYIQSDNSKITVKYIYNYEYVKVQIVSTVKMENTKSSSWELSNDGYIYTRLFYENVSYTTQVDDVNGLNKQVKINVDFFPNKIVYETGTYGYTGAVYKGAQGGTTLKYYRFGQGPNVMFATFCVHGYEDSWNKDGEVLTNIANDFYNKLVSNADIDLANKWTIYIFPQVNPDGINLGYTNNGPGRTTVYSKIDRGIDINRSWQTDSYYKVYTDARNYNGTSGFQAYEAENLKNFLLSNKSKTGQTVLVDLHGWENQLIGDEQICKYYKQQYTSCATNNYGKYGTQYIISWARQNLGAKVALVELPLANNQTQVNSMNLSEKYINATLNMLKGI